MSTGGQRGDKAARERLLARMEDELLGRAPAPIKVLSIFGTRPEVIKMAPVLRELDRHPEAFDSRICVTGQHREMLTQMLDLFELEPHHDLEIMRPGQSFSDITVAALLGLEPILHAERPNWVLTQGDTTTAMAASLAAFYQGVSVGHVEAGLRTHDKREPLPEELNRRIAGVVADLHFAPTEWAADNLRKESTPEREIVVTGNTVIDALEQVAALPFDQAASALADVPVGDKRIVLVTAHRGENFGEAMTQICAGVREMAAAHDDVHVVWPVHMNPKVRGQIHSALGHVPNVTLLAPLDYQPLVWLLKRCHFVITDSGGLQEEGAAIGKPILVLRNTTERPEGVQAGTAMLVGADADRLADSAGRLLRDSYTYKSMARPVHAYGDGHAAEHIVEALRWARAPRRAVAERNGRPLPVGAGVLV